MKIIFLASLVIGAAALAGCTNSYTSPVQVTRFTAENAQGLAQGPILVVAAPGMDGDSLQFAAYRDAVASELAALGYTLANEKGAPQLAEIRIERFVAQQEQQRSPVSVGVGGRTGSYGSGVGLGLGIDLSGKPPELLDSELGVTLRNRADGKPLWEGRAGFATRADGELADARANATKLAKALFAGFPGESGETISVK